MASPVSALTRYRSIRPVETLSLVAVGALALTAVPAGIEVISAVSRLVVSRGSHGDLVNLGTAQARIFDDLDRVVTIGGALTWLVSAVVFLAWLFRARANVDVFDRYVQRWGRPWLFFGWVVPLANLVIPHRIVTDLWIGSNPTDEEARQHGSTSLVDYWWMFFLLSWFVGRVVGNLDPQSTGGFVLRACAEVVDGAVGITAAVLAVRIVLGVNKGLREQTAALGLPGSQ